MRTADRIAFLKKTDLLAEVPEYLFKQIAESMQEMEAQAGTTVFREGDTGDAVYLVVDGALRIEKNGIRLVTRSRGECVGEFALIDDAPRSASTVAETDVLLLKWARKDFLETLLQSREVTYGIFKILTGKLRQDVALQVTAALEQERWRQDLERAHEVQMAMLPGGDLSTEQVEISGYCQPAADVGGDYYDYLPLEGDQMGLIIGDATGHGFYAGLFVAMAKSCLHTQATIDHSPEKVMEAMDRTVSISVQSGLLMTCCYVLIDFRRHLLTYCNAGHPYPYHYSRVADRPGRLVSTDLLLGVPGFGAARFTKAERAWERGDLLLLFSDGVTEAEDARGEQFEEERLERVLIENRDRPPAQIRDSVLNALSDHCRGVAQSDDITLMVVRAV